MLRQSEPILGPLASLFAICMAILFTLMIVVVLIARIISW